MKLYLSDDNLRLLKALAFHRVMCGTRKRFSMLKRDGYASRDGWSGGIPRWRITRLGEFAADSLKRGRAAA